MNEAQNSKTKNHSDTPPLVALPLHIQKYMYFKETKNKNDLPKTYIFFRWGDKSTEFLNVSLLSQ